MFKYMGLAVFVLTIERFAKQRGVQESTIHYTNQVCYTKKEERHSSSMDVCTFR